jgi:hypothetical protein
VTTGRKVLSTLAHLVGGKLIGDDGSTPSSNHLTYLAFAKDLDLLFLGGGLRPVVLGRHSKRRRFFLNEHRPFRSSEIEWARGA